MGATNEADLLRELEGRYRAMGHEEVVQALMALMRWQFEILTKRKAGGKARAHHRERQKVLSVYLDLKAGLGITALRGKRPSFKALMNELDVRYPHDPWNDDTVNSWWKRLNKGEQI